MSAQHPTTTCRFLWLLLCVAVLAPAGCAGPQLAPTPILWTISDENPFADVPASAQTTTVTMIYGTDRAATKAGNDGRFRYGAGRCGSLSVGTCQVSIGKDITWDQLVRESRTAWPCPIS